jgi:alanine racemase
MARAWADISLPAVRANVEELRRVASPAEVCAVVKADGYGHGAVPVARAALEAGATWLAVAHVAEAVPLRAEGIDAPILLLSEPSEDQVHHAVRLGLHITAYTKQLIAKLGQAAEATGATVPVHLKVDTGMHRVGARPEDAVALAMAVTDHPALELQAVWTHCAVADEPDNPFTAEQLAQYDAVVAEVEAAGIPVPLRHAANSAAALLHPAARYDLVRCGIAVYGVPPAPQLAGAADLELVVRLATDVAFVKEVSAGERISYGLRHRFEHDTVVATLPIGYADGVFRRLGLEGQEVLIGGRRHPMVGVVTMDQVMVDVGPDSSVRAGDEVVLLGQQGDEQVTPDEWAARVGTIAYEVVCALGARVERRHVEGV